MLKHIFLSIVIPIPFYTHKGIESKKITPDQKRNEVLYIGGIGPNSPQTASRLREILNEHFARL